jgi:hypothetical protein
VEMDRTCTEERKWSHRKVVLDWNPQGKRRRVRPRHTWRRTVHNKALEKGKSWNEVKRMAGNRTRWRCFVDALCPLRDERSWWWWCLTQADGGSTILRNVGSHSLNDTVSHSWWPSKHVLSLPYQISWSSAWATWPLKVQAQQSFEM